MTYSLYTHQPLYWVHLAIVYCVSLLDLFKIKTSHVNMSCCSDNCVAKQDKKDFLQCVRVKAPSQHLISTL